MALRKLTKHSVTGSLLVQYKYSTINITGSSSGTGDTILGNGVTITPQYSDSILETTFSGDIDNQDRGENNHYRVALYVNGAKEYEQTELLGGPNGGHAATHHGGNSDRIYANALTPNVKNMRQSVGLVHAFGHGSLNAQHCAIAIASYDNGGKTLSLDNGFLIVKEVSVGIVGLNGPQ
jgi:hypothetical protein